MIKCFNVLSNLLEINEKKLVWEKNISYKEESNGNYRTENYSNRKLSGWTQQNNGGDRGKSHWTRRTIEIAQSEQREKNLKKIRPSETFGYK